MKSACVRPLISARLLLVATLLGSVMIAWCSAPAVADAQMTYQAGQSIEVREGDVWSAASVIRREGRRYLVHYAGSDSSNDEWVGTDRMRVPGSTDATGAPSVGVTPQPSVSANGSDESVPPKTDGAITEIDPNRTLVEDEQPAEAPSQWSAAADPSPIQAPVHSFTLRTRSMNDKMDIQQLLPCGDGGAIVGFTNFGEKDRRIERVGTTSGNLRAVLPAGSLPLAASPSGRLLVCRCNAFGFGNNARIDAFTLTPGAQAVTPLVSFTPYPSEESQGKPEDIRFAAALSDTRIVTCDLKGRLIAWDIGPGAVTGVWRADVGGMYFGGFGVNVVLSPGGKWLATASNAGITFVDAATGHILGVIPTSFGEPARDLTCSPTGKTLVAFGPGNTLVSFDVATGKLIRFVALPDNVGGSMDCPDDGFALLNCQTLIHTRTGAILQQAHLPEGMSRAATGPGVTLLASGSRLLVMHIPDEPMLAAIGPESDAELALKPGVPVAVDIQLDMSDADRAAVDAAIRKKLTDDGFVIASSADTVVTCRTEPGAQHEHNYAKSQFGMPVFMGFGGTSMILMDKVTRITIVQKGQTIWERKRVCGPASSYRLNDGESLEDGAKATIHYDPQFLINIVIPPYIAQPPADQAK